MESISSKTESIYIKSSHKLLVDIQFLKTASEVYHTV
nr:MAG TPA: hypothetical protein [Caudoviricetes sp.]